MDWVVTGASRGIGRAVALALLRKEEPGRLFAVARDRDKLTSLSHESSASLEVRAADLSRLDQAQQLGDALASEIAEGTTLIHNAGIWPTTKVLVDGYEAAFALNCLGGLALQRPLLASGRIGRVLVVSAGLLIKGRFDEAQTPTGDDFSKFRTYCTTKLAGAIAMREMARRHPSVDVAIVHPGVVRTDLGAMGGPLGWLMNLIKRSWETPEACAERLMRLLSIPTWAHTPGEAAWFVEEEREAWPAPFDRDEEAVLRTVEAALGPSALGVAS